MFVHVILFYQIKSKKSIGKCPSSWTSTKHFKVQMICLSDINKSDVINCFDIVIKAIVKKRPVDNKFFRAGVIDLCLFPRTITCVLRVLIDLISIHANCLFPDVFAQQIPAADNFSLMNYTRGDFGSIRDKDLRSALILDNPFGATSYNMVN